MVVKRKYVIPGELIVEGNYRPIANVFRSGEKLYSERVGMAEISSRGVRVIPLSGPYLPRPDDIVVGKIIDYSAFAWEVDINSCFHAYLPAQSVFGRSFSPARDPLVRRLGVGDMVAARIAAFDRLRDPLLTISGSGLGRLNNGEVVRMAPTKVPRLIGKNGSMVKTIEHGTGCKLMIGQNGAIVVTGSPDGILKVKRAIKLVEEGAHIADLTQKVQESLLEPKEVG